MAIFIGACSAGAEITVHSDNSATVQQQYLESSPYPEYKQDSLGYLNTEEERKRYDAPIISDFKDFYGTWFTFKIGSIDSLTKYLSRMPEDYVQINAYGDSLLVFKVHPPVKKPKKLYDYYFQFDFDNSVKNVSSSKGNHVFWEPKKDPNRVTISLLHRKIWKKQKGVLVVVELNKDAR